MPTTATPTPTVLRLGAMHGDFDVLAVAFAKPGRERRSRTVGGYLKALA